MKTAQKDARNSFLVELELYLLQEKYSKIDQLSIFLWIKGAGPDQIMIFVIRGHSSIHACNIRLIGQA